MQMTPHQKHAWRLGYFAMWFVINALLFAGLVYFGLKPSDAAALSALLAFVTGYVCITAMPQ